MSIMEANQSTAVIAVNVTMKQERKKNYKTLLKIRGGNPHQNPIAV